MILSGLRLLKRNGEGFVYECVHRLARVALLASIVLAGCREPAGPTGPSGSNGHNGSDGTNGAR
jgi:hypothetical protein